MISNARGKHFSPGVYMEELEKTYANKSLGITTLGVVGETLNGPAFEPVRISDWAEFKTYFGGTSTEKFKGTKYPKYELPYIAKSYLQESKNLEVCRILGFSGYDAGPAFVIHGVNGSDKYPIAILRSKATYNTSSSTDVCSGDANMDAIKFLVSDVTATAYNEIVSNFNGCTNTNTSNTGALTVGSGNYGKMLLTISGENISETVAVSLNPSDKNYIVNILGMSAQDGDYSIFVEEMYDLAHIKACNSGLYTTIACGEVTDVNNYKTQYRYASTPWFVSELKGNGTNVEMKKLFRFHTISDGNSANRQIKVSIANIMPDEACFDVIIRDFNDTDNAQIVLERFDKCNMVPGHQNYIGFRIGSFDGEYDNKSKYVTVEVSESDSIENSVPCGFMGYPLRKMTNYKAIDMMYNTQVIEILKPNRQFFGLSDITGIDQDVFSFKGADEDVIYTNGFHLDSLVKASGVTVTVDGVSGFTFETPAENEGSHFGAKSMPRITDEDSMKNNIYADKRLRKFTCCPFGGFDGWDIYREQRTNTSEYRANRYVGLTDRTTSAFKSNDYFDGSVFDLTGKYNNSDYYAYLAGYKQFENPSKIKINILATPGIDFVNNLDLVNEVLDIVEESRQGDCLYIVTTPEHDKNGRNFDAVDVVNELSLSELNTSYAATYYPWVKYFDNDNKKYINLPVTKDVVRNFAHTDNVAHPWFASAGMSRGVVDCVKATHFTKLEEEDTLYEGMINPVKSFGPDGVKIWGNKTMYQEDTPLNRINVRRLMIRIKDLVMSAAKQLIFEQNDNTVDAQFRSIVDPILANAKQNRGISDYRIKTDTSVEARERKELPAAIYVKPIGCLEYIPITFTVYSEGAKFDE